ncbi:MAG: contractile injection system protein, VgrG/Pvc8 family [Pseudomonadota bacterium]
MNQPISIARESDFYVPSFEIRVRGRRLDRTVINDVTRLEYVDDLEAIDQFSLTVNNWDAERRAFKYSDGDLFLPRAQIEIDLGYHPSDMHRVMTGTITDMQVSFPAGGQSVLTLQGLNRLDDLRGEQRSQVFENMTDSEIARQIVGPMDLALRTDREAEGREEAHEFVFQHNQYDLLFLKDRARRLGYDIVVEETPDGQPGLYFGPSDTIAQRPVYKLTYGSTLIDFAPRFSTARQVGGVRVQAWDRRNKEPIVGEARRSDLRTRGVGDAGQQSRVDSDLESRVEVIADHPVRSQREADILARETLEKTAKEMVQGNGSVVGLPRLRAGGIVYLEGLGTRFSGRHLLTKTIHSIDDSGYATRFECRREEID